MKLFALYGFNTPEQLIGFFFTTPQLFAEVFGINYVVFGSYCRDFLFSRVTLVVFRFIV